MDLSIVIVSYNTLDLLKKCLESLEAHRSQATAEVIVVDNGSSDGTVDMVRSQFADARVIANKTNLGSTAAYNQAILLASGRYVMLLNSDTLMLESTLDRVVSFMDEHPDVAVVGCKLLNPDGSLQPTITSFPTITKDVLNTAFRGSLLRNTPATRARLGKLAPLLGISMSRFDTHSETKEIDFPRAACLAARREAFDQVGLLDEGFFFTGEEADWCYRLKQAGWKVYYLAEAAVVHRDHGSTGGYSGRRYLQNRKSSLQFYEKHYSRGYVLASKVLMSLVLAVRVALVTVRLPFAGEKRTDLLRTRETLWSQMRLYFDERFREQDMLFGPIFRHLT